MLLDYTSIFIQGKELSKVENYRVGWRKTDKRERSEGERSEDVRSEDVGSEDVRSGDVSSEDVWKVVLRGRGWGS